MERCHGRYAFGRRCYICNKVDIVSYVWYVHCGKCLAAEAVQKHRTIFLNIAKHIPCFNMFLYSKVILFPSRNVRVYNIKKDIEKEICNIQVLHIYVGHRKNILFHSSYLFSNQANAFKIIILLYYMHDYEDMTMIMTQIRNEF